jgi:hypothetical protein
MSCSACEAKDRAIADMTLELAAWRSGEQADQARADMADRRDRWQRRLRLAPAAARVLIALTDAAPRSLSFDRLAAVANPGRDIEELGQIENLARQYISICRLAIRAAGLVLTVRPVWGHGYVVEAGEAQTFRRAMGDA